MERCFFVIYIINTRFILNVLPLYLDKISRVLCVVIMNKFILDCNVLVCVRGCVRGDGAAPSSGTQAGRQCLRTTRLYITLCNSCRWSVLVVFSIILQKKVKL